MRYPAAIPTTHASQTGMTAQAFPHLTKAPIFEATVELRVAGVTGERAEHGFDEVRNALEPDFPRHNPIRFVTPHFKFSLKDEGEKAETRIDRGVLGVQLVSEDEKFVVHAKRDSLVVSRMAPYTNWGDLLDWVKVVWPVYLHNLAPTSIGRIGVRYINHVPFAPPKIDTEHIFTAGPRIPRALPQSFLEFATRAVIPMPDYGAGVAIVQGAGLPRPAGGPPNTLTLDIDAFTVGDPFEPGALERLWERMENLHVVKNIAFFSSLHEKVWRQYE